MTYLEKKSKVDGPVVWLTGTLHGDEPGGGAVIKKLFAELEKVELVKGSLHALPLVNETGADKKVRELPETGEDLNRLFPGQVDGTLGQKIVHNVWQTIIETKPDLVLDLHNDWINSIPYTLIDDRNSMLPDFHARLSRMALSAGLVTVQEISKTLNQTLSGSLTKIGIPALTLELGGAYIVDEKNVRIGVNAILRILCHFGLIAENKTLDVNDTPTSSVGSTGKIFNYSDEPKPIISGPIQMLVEPGQVIKKGDLIARIEGGEELFANQNAIVLGYTDETISRPGQEMVALGVVN
jgi:predicted deacylase